MTFYRQSCLIKNFRKKNGLTQSALAKKLGVHTQLVSNIEREEQGISIRIAKKLMDLGISRASLLSAYMYDYKKFIQRELE